MWIFIEDGRQRSGTSSRKSIGDPTAISSRRSSAFGRYERRLCSKIVEELISAEDAVPFILPVDTRAVSHCFAVMIEVMNFVILNSHVDKQELLQAIRYVVLLWLEELLTQKSTQLYVFTALLN